MKDQPWVEHIHFLDMRCDLCGDNIEDGVTYYSQVWKECKGAAWRHQDFCRTCYNKIMQREK
jgi:hypothetical protein